VQVTSNRVLDSNRCVVPTDTVTPRACLLHS